MAKEKIEPAPIEPSTDMSGRPVEANKRPRWLAETLLIIFAIIAYAVFQYLNAPDKLTGTPAINNNAQATGQWQQTENGWEAKGKVPACPEPLTLASVADLSLATSVLYPGQMRSVGYENTAGFRFDKSSNEEIVISAPLDGEIVQAARYLVEGELQYVFDIISPCGIMNRFDHLLTLPSKLQLVVDDLPAPKEGDNRSTFVNPRIAIKQGETVATAIGIRTNNNTFLSRTVFDLRQKNRISQENAAWAAEHPSLDHYAICPFPYLPETDQERIAALPAADSMSGSQSDFCD